MMATMIGLGMYVSEQRSSHLQWLLLLLLTFSSTFCSSATATIKTGTEGFCGSLEEFNVTIVITIYNFYILSLPE